MYIMNVYYVCILYMYEYYVGICMFIMYAYYVYFVR